MTTLRFLTAATLAFGLSLPLMSVVSSPAQAAGCGGYVNVAVWGCAPWDNNDKNKQPIKAQAPAPEVERKVKLGPGNTPPGYVITKPGTPGYNFRQEHVSPAPPVWNPNMPARR